MIVVKEKKPVPHADVRCGNIRGKETDKEILLIDYVNI